MNPAATVAIAFGASLLGAVSGGSSSMITTPAWVALGSPFPVAVAADKVAGSFWTVAAARGYLKGVSVDRRLMLIMGAAGLIGAAVGALVATALNETLLRRGAGLLILAAIALSLVPKRSQPGAGAGPAALLWGFPLGLYEGVLGSGNAILTTLLLQRIRGWDLLTALGHYYALAAGWCAFAAIVYLSRGAFDPGLALYATLGSVAGGALGARMGRAHGTRLVRPLFLLAGTALALYLVTSHSS